jgi:hypothetical protein
MHDEASVTSVIRGLQPQLQLQRRVPEEELRQQVQEFLLDDEQ